jgi:hypothetical protein
LNRRSVILGVFIIVTWENYQINISSCALNFKLLFRCDAFNWEIFIVCFVCCLINNWMPVGTHVHAPSVTLLDMIRRTRGAIRCNVRCQQRFLPVQNDNANGLFFLWFVISSEAINTSIKFIILFSKTVIINNLLYLANKQRY